MEFYWQGHTRYDQALNNQMESTERVRATGVSEILGFEHPSTITLGRRANFEKETNFSISYFENQNIHIARIDRGGMATLHSPGQLVIYPILSLKKYSLGVRDFLCLMECTTKDTLKELGVSAKAKESLPGLYTEKGKIAFFGFRIDRGVSRHGISINVNNDLSLFNSIKSCGIQNQTLDRTIEYSAKNTQAIFDIWSQKLKINLTPKDS